MKGQFALILAAGMICTSQAFADTATGSTSTGTTTITATGTTSTGVTSTGTTATGVTATGTTTATGVTSTGTTSTGVTSTGTTSTGTTSTGVTATGVTSTGTTSTGVTSTGTTATGVTATGTTTATGVTTVLYAKEKAQIDKGLRNIFNKLNAKYKNRDVAYLTYLDQVVAQIDKLLRVDTITPQKRSLLEYIKNRILQKSALIKQRDTSDINLNEIFK